MTATGVSAIVPIHNEDRVLGHVLDSIEAQTRRPDELVLVFDRCTDASEEVARGRANRTVRVDMGNTAAAVRAGLEQSTHDWFVLFDGNTLVPEDYVERLLKSHNESLADVIEWHGGLMFLTRDTLNRYGQFSGLYLWTLEYFLRVVANGGTVLHLNGPFDRLRPSPLRRNLRYGVEYADLSARYRLTPFFRIGTKSGWLPDIVAILGAIVGHRRRGRLGLALKSLPKGFRRI